MTDRKREVISGVLWPDASLLGISLDYDAVRLRLRETTGVVKTIRAEGYIGVSLLGFWDEMVVEDAQLCIDHPTARRAVESLAARLAAGWPDSGNLARNSRDWQTLVVRLVDGATVEVVAAEFSVEASA